MCGPTYTAEVELLISLRILEKCCNDFFFFFFRYDFHFGDNCSFLHLFAHRAKGLDKFGLKENVKSKTGRGEKWITS